MLAKWGLTFAFVLCVCSMEAAIDFSPIRVDITDEGIVTHQLNFYEDGRKVAYVPPVGWTFSGGISRFTLIPPGAIQARAEVQEVDLEPGPVFNESARRQLEKQVIGSVSEDAQSVTLVAVEEDAIVVNGGRTFGVTVSYTLYGREFLMNVLFADLPETQLRFRCQALKEDFAAILRAFRGSICTLQWLEQSQDTRLSAGN